MGVMVDPKGGYIARGSGLWWLLGASVFIGAEQKQLLSEVADFNFKTTTPT